MRATHSFAAKTSQDAVERAERHFDEFFEGEPFVIVDVDAEAVLTVGGKVLHWDVRVVAETMTGGLRKVPDRDPLVRVVAAALDLADHDPNGSPPDEAVAWTVDADYLRELAAAVRVLIDERGGQ